MVGSQKCRQSLVCPHSLFEKIQSFSHNFRFERQVIYGKAEHKGSAMVPSERVLVSSYRLSIVTFPVHVYRLIYAFQRLPLLCSSTPLFPTATLVSQTFFHVSLGLGVWLLGYKQRRCWANCLCNYFPRCPTYVITIYQHYRQTETWTTCHRKASLCTVVHCATKNSLICSVY